MSVGRPGRFARWLTLAAVAAAAMPLLAGRAHAGDHFVITASFKSQTEAQAVAATKGGWVLDTDVYPALAPGMFAVVRGPFRTPGEAGAELKFLATGGRYPGAYVKDAGAPRLKAGVGSPALTPQILAALLGELAVEVTRHQGGGHPCEPQEPYDEIRLSFADVERTYDDATGTTGERAVRADVDLRGFWMIRRTGEIDRMRQCTE